MTFSFSFLLEFFSLLEFFFPILYTFLKFCHNVTIVGFHYIWSAQNEWFRAEISMIYFHNRETCAYLEESKNSLLYSLHICANRASLHAHFWTLKIILTSFLGETWSPSSPHKWPIFLKKSFMIFYFFINLCLLYLISVTNYFWFQIVLLQYLQVVIVLATILLAVDSSDQRLKLFYFVVLILLLF